MNNNFSLKVAYSSTIFIASIVSVVMKILIVKLSALGDVIHTYPVVSYLRTRFPEAQIDWVVSREAAVLVESHPSVDRAIVVDSKGWRVSFGAFSAFRTKLRGCRYDLLFDLQGNMKSGFVTATAWADRKIGFARPFLPEWPNALATRERFSPPAGSNVRSDYLTTVAHALGEGEVALDGAPVHLKLDESSCRVVDHLMRHPHLVDRRVVMVCPGSAWRNKCVTYDALLDFLRRIAQGEELSFLWVWGSGEERELVERLALQFPLTSLIAPKLTLPALQNLMWRMDRIVAMDSLPLHLAGTTQTPTLSVFGPSSAEKYQPLGSHHRIMQGSCPYGRTFDRRCPKLRTCSTGLCTRGLSGDDLYRGLVEVSGRGAGLSEDVRDHLPVEIDLTHN